MKQIPTWIKKKYIPVFILLVIIVFPHILYRDTLSSEVIIGYPGGDTLSQGALFTEFAWDSIKQDGEPAFYNPYLFCGMPFLESQSYSYSYPFNWTFLLLPFVFAFNYQFAFHLVILGLITAITVGWYYKKPLLGLIATLFIFTNAHIISLTYPGHGGKFFALLYFLPLFYLFRSLLQKYHPVKVIIFIFLTILQIKTGHLQIVFYTGGFLFLYFIYFFFEKYSQRNFREWRNISLLLLSMGVLIVLGSAHSVFPALHYRQFTIRAEPMEQEEALRGSLPVSEISEMFWFNAFGYSHSEDYTGEMNERLVSDFILPFILFLSLLYFRRGSKERWFFLGIFLLAIFLAPGKYNPVLPVIYQIFPMLSYFRAPMAILCLVHFSLIIASLESLAEKYYLCIQQKDVLIAGLLLLLTFFLTPAQYFLSTSFFITLSLYIFLFLTVVIPQKNIPVILILALIFNLILGTWHSRNFIVTEPSRSYYHHLQSPTLLRFMSPGSESRILFVENEKTNRFMHQKISSLYGYHPLAPQPYLEYTKTNPPLENPQLYNLRLVLSYIPLSPPGFEEVSLAGIPYAYKNPKPSSFVQDITNDDVIPYTFNRHSANSFQVRFSLEEEREVLIAENYFPGWTVERNGKIIEPAKATHPFFEFQLSAGEHILEFTYSFPFRYLYIITFVLFLFGLFLIKYFPNGYSPLKKPDKGVKDVHKR